MQPCFKNDMFVERPVVNAIGRFLMRFFNEHSSCDEQITMSSRAPSGSHGTIHPCP